MKATLFIGLAAAIFFRAAAAETAHSEIVFMGSTNFLDWVEYSSRTTENAVTMTSRPLKPKIAWDEFIVSWNVSSDPGDQLRFEVSAFLSNRWTKFFTMGVWSAEANSRHSVTNQADPAGDVETDLLKLKGQASEIRLRVTKLAQTGEPKGRLKFIGLCFRDSSRAAPEPPVQMQALAPLAVPEKSQLAYDGGAAWCSPTSTSMVLSYWAEKMARPELARDVTEVAKAVHDRNWPGTGNWPFNTAYAGSFPGIRAYVARFSGVAEIQSWLAKGIPVITSVSYPVLKGGAKRRGDGHLIVVVGFGEDGQVIVNDPGTRQDVRRSYPLENFQKAWAYSGRTVYLIYPETMAPPADDHDHWFD